MKIHNESALAEITGCEEPAIVKHDDSLILWMLELTPEKRLEALQNFVDGVVAIQHAKARHPISSSNSSRF